MRESPYFRLGPTGVEGVACLQRTASAYPSLEEVHDEVEAVLACLAERRIGGGLIVDMRRARPRNDDAFEQAMERLRLGVGEYFSPVVILVRTAAGQMQSTRLHRETGVHYAITSDADEAVRMAQVG